MRSTLKFALVLLVLAVLSPCLVHAEKLTKTFAHQLLVVDPPQSWEHRIDLPEEFAQKGLYFTKRNFRTQGKLAVEIEEFKPTYYYVKVRLPKMVGQGMAGDITIELDVEKPQPLPPVLGVPTELKLFPVAPALRPCFQWKGAEKYAAVALCDAASGKTIFERVVRGWSSCGVEEIWLELGHHYIWAVRQADETARYSPESQARFRIEKVDGIVVTVPE